MLERNFPNEVRIWILAAILLSTILPARAQTVISQIEGQLVSPTGRPPCAYCPVQLEDQAGRSGMALTSGMGEFTFRNLKENVYRIRVTARDYEEVSLPVMLTPETTRVTIELKLRKSETDLSGPGAQVVNRSTAMEFQPKEALDLYKKASKNRVKNNFEEAAHQYESIFEMAPKFYLAHLELGLSYQAIGRLKDAELQFQLAGDLDSSSADPLIHLGEVHILRGEWGYAAEASVNAIRRDPKSPQPYLNMGLAFYCSGMLDLAKDSLERALNASPKPMEARLLLVNIYLNVHDDRRALEQLDLYLSKTASRSQPADLSALRYQLKNGTSYGEKRHVSVPIRIGSTLMKDACLTDVP